MFTYFDIFIIHKDVNLVLGLHTASSWTKLTKYLIIYVLFVLIVGYINAYLNAQSLKILESDYNITTMHMTLKGCFVVWEKKFQLSFKIQNINTYNKLNSSQ